MLINRKWWKALLAVGLAFSAIVGWCIIDILIWAVHILLSLGGSNVI